MFVVIAGGCTSPVAGSVANDTQELDWPTAYSIILLTRLFVRLFVCLTTFLLLTQVSAGLLSAPIGSVPSDTTRVQPGTLTTSLSLAARYRVDTTNRLQINTAAELPFETAPQREFLLNYSTHPIWLRFTLRQTDARPTDYLLELSNWFADYVDFYVPQPAGGFRVVHAGDRVAWRDRSPQTRYPSAAFRLNDTRPHTLYVRVVSTQYHNYDLRLWRQAAFIRNQLTSNRTAFSLGLVLTRFAFQLALLIFMFRYSAFRGYSVFGLSACLVFLLAGGNYNIFFPASPYWANVSYFVSVALIPIALSYYVYEVFDVRRNFRWMQPILLIISGISLAYLLFNLGWQHAYVTWVFAGFMAITLTFFILMLTGLYIRGPRPVIWYVLPFPIHLIPYAYIYARNAGFLPGTIHEEQLQYSLVVQFFVLPFFIAGMLRHSYRERMRTLRDLAIQKAERNQLLELDRLKTNFFTNISHEFRTPLTLILGPLSDLKQRYPTETSLPLMEKNGRRLLGLVNQLLDLTQLEAGQQQPSPHPGDLAVFFRTLAGSFESLAQSNSVRFQLDQHEQSYWADFDSDKLEKITTNLLANAFKFTPAGQSVCMTVQYHPAQLVLTVQDTGIGIAPDRLPHIFERFYRAQDESKYEGTGIGLSLVGELVHILQGTINVSSTPGQGSTFVVCLPLVPAPETTAESPGQIPDPAVLPPAAAPGHADPIRDESRLLIVDDNADIRAYVRSLFAADYQVLEAVDGLAGLEQATQYLPDIVLCDLMMPRLDGLAFCQTMKTQAATSHIPIIMLTARSTTNDRIESLELGADDYLTKPFDRTELRVRVRNLIQQRQRLYKWLKGGSPDTVISQQPVPVIEQKFIRQLTEAVQQRIDDPTFGVEELAEAVSLSRSQLHRKLKALADTTATLFIRDIRLTQAAALLGEGSLTVTQVAYAVGFDNPSYFAKLFQERYNVSPSQYVRERGQPIP